MNSTQHLSLTVSKKLNEDKENQELFKDRSYIGFLSTTHTRNSYHAKTNWVLYRINLVTEVLVKLQQKTNLSLNDRLDPQTALRFGAHTWYEKWYFYYLVSDFCAGNRFKHGKYNSK